MTRSQPPSGLMTTSSIPVAVDSYELDHSGSASKGTEYSLRRPTAGPHRSLADICKGGGGEMLILRGPLAAGLRIECYEYI